MKKFLLVILSILCGVILIANLAACDKSFEQLNNEYGITIEGGGFDEKCSVVVEKIDVASVGAESIIEAIKEKVYNKAAELLIYDISVVKDGLEVQPNGKVKVTIPTILKADTDYVVYHIKNSGEIQELVPQIEEGKIIVETDSFSVFVIAEVQGVLIDFYAYPDTPEKGELLIDGLNVDANDCYMQEMESGESVAIEAKAKEGYEFVGWYDNSHIGTTGDINLLSEEAIYNFTARAQDVSVYAYFIGKTTGITLDGANAGFTAGNTIVQLGSEIRPNPEMVVVYLQRTSEDNQYLAVSEYTIDLGGLDFEKIGTYTITYTYNANTAYTATLIVEVQGVFIDFYAYPDTPEKGELLIDGLNVDANDCYMQEMESGESVAIEAKAKEGYEFVGWYDNSHIGTTGDINLLSEEAIYNFTARAQDVSVYAYFIGKTTGITLDGANAGFTAGNTIVQLGSEIRPNPEMVVVYLQRTSESDQCLVESEYTIDLGGLDFETVGTYTITYTYNANTSYTSTLIVEVADIKELVGIAIDFGDSGFTGYGQTPDTFFVGSEDKDLSKIKIMGLYSLDGEENNEGIFIYNNYIYLDLNEYTIAYFRGYGDTGSDNIDLEVIGEAKVVYTYKYLEGVTTEFDFMVRYPHPEFVLNVATSGYQSSFTNESVGNNFKVRATEQTTEYMEGRIFYEFLLDNELNSQKDGGRFNFDYTDCGIQIDTVYYIGIDVSFDENLEIYTITFTGSFSTASGYTVYYVSDTSEGGQILVECGVGINEYVFKSSYNNNFPQIEIYVVSDAVKNSEGFDYNTVADLSSTVSGVYPVKVMFDTTNENNHFSVTSVNNSRVNDGETVPYALRTSLLAGKDLGLESSDYDGEIGEYIDLGALNSASLGGGAINYWFHNEDGTIKLYLFNLENSLTFKTLTGGVVQTDEGGDYLIITPSARFITNEHIVGSYGEADAIYYGAYYYFNVEGIEISSVTYRFSYLYGHPGISAMSNDIYCTYLNNVNYYADPVLPNLTDAHRGYDEGVWELFFVEGGTYYELPCETIIYGT